MGNVSPRASVRNKPAREVKPAWKACFLQLLVHSAGDRQPCSTVSGRRDACSDYLVREDATAPRIRLVYLSGKEAHQDPSDAAL